MSSIPLVQGEVTARSVRRWAWATLVANTVIILTGGLVRLTGSGLGCPEWPRCTDQSFVPHRELGVHGVIEFGNRMLTYVLVAVVVLNVVAVWRWARSTPALRRGAVAIALGIPLQGVVGGITVLTHLNPWVVALHLVLSMALVALSVWFLLAVTDAVGVPAPLGVRRATVLLQLLAWVVVYLGTVVTGSGPHAGDASAPRNGLDPQVWSHVHAAAVYALVAVTLVLRWATRGTALRGAVTAVVVVELVQGAVGFAQYWTGLPVPLVALHLLGAAALVATSTRLLLLARGTRAVAGSAPRRDDATVGA